MIGTDQIDRLNGATVVDADGDKIGTVGQVFVDANDGHPSWVTVRTGLFGAKETFVPLDEATSEGDTLRVHYDKATVKDAPRIDTDSALSPEEEDELYRYYNLSSSETSTHSGTDYTDTTGLGTGTGYTDAGTTGYADTTSQVGGPGHDTSGPNTDEAMTRSEERLNIGTERVQTGRARLRKYIVTENQTVTVPVEREEVRLEREPITDANAGAALDGPALSEEEHEVTLTEERPVVNKETVPVERVRLDTETVTENRQVSEEVRKEQIDFDGESGRDRV
ncbi:DUF2382 domain-containing protein [Naasia sp. SYSU D00948]|uniref:DUF2382 domain-containing protein n=1 Tax=Naasia sp. SYSU D00948 TaxID=2817379 RepID=UPI001B3124FE|nr:PRC and DUF2382 domain-containing protein [Naasia sp. SYSU D00948]